MNNEISAFAIEVATNMVGILMLAYVGATVMSILNMSSAEVNLLLPTDLSQPPYNYSADTPNSEKYNLRHDNSKHAAMHDTNASFVQRTRELLEYFYPMETVSSPYTSWFMHPNFQGTKGHLLAQWFALSCANAFCWWRSIYKGLILIGRWMLSFEWKTVVDWLIFYLFPYFLYWFILLPIMPFVGFALTALGSAMKNIPGSYMLTLAPFFGGLFAVGALLSGGVFNVYSWILFFMIFSSGFAISVISFFWWALVGVAMWAYTVFFLFCAPILSNSGLDKVWQEFGNHQTSLKIIFLIFLVMSAKTHLSAIVFQGISVGSVLVGLIILYRWKYS